MKSTLIILLLVAAAVYSGCAGRPESTPISTSDQTPDREDIDRAEKTLEIAQDYFEEGKLPEAIDRYRELLGEKELEEELYVEGSTGLVRALIYDDQWEEALEVAREAVSEIKESAPLYSSLGSAYYALGDYQVAAETFFQATHLDIQDPYANYGLGKVFLLIKKIPTAKLFLEKAVRYKDDAPEFYLSLADIFIADRNYAKAIENCERYLSFDLKYDKKLKKLVEAHVKVLKSFGEEPPYQVSAPDVSEIPFELLLGLPVVEVSINGHEPRKFVFDTGASKTVIDEEYARQIGLKAIAQIDGKGIAHDIRVSWAKPDSVRLGEFEIRNVAAGIVSMRPMLDLLKSKKEEGLILSSNEEIPELTGLIGVGNLFKDYCVTLDYKEQVIRVASDPPDGEAVPALKMQLFIRGSMPHLFCAVAGKTPRPFCIDTGAKNTSLYTDYTNLEEIPLSPAPETMGGAGVGGYHDVMVVEKGDMLVGNLYVTISPLMVITMDSEIERVLKYGVIGNDILTIFNPTFDFKNAMLIVPMPEEAEKPGSVQ
jgi:tetratricopeptide (TPR) repeat protein